MIHVLIVIALLLGGIGVLRTKAHADVKRRWEADSKLVEEAPWFGQTGLGDSVERELPRYLRREFGEVGAEDGLKAADLSYLGVQTDEQGATHVWAIPSKTGSACTHAYIEVHATGALCFGWGEREPAKQQAANLGD